MSDSNARLTNIISAIARLSAEERRRLLQQLRVSGLLLPESYVSDEARLHVAPALGSERLSTWRSPREVAAEPATPPPPVAAKEIPAVDPQYRSKVSGRVVVGSPSVATESDDPHTMPPLPGQAPEQPITLIFDGGSKGNPGQGYGSYALSWPGEPRRVVRLQFGSRVTNNEAEYDTLIAAVEAVLARLEENRADPQTARLQIRGDSLLVVNQVNGAWKCKKPELQSRQKRARSLLERFGVWRLAHHDRSKSVDVLGH